ncbi:TPA: restriction endonuclease subunit S [Haemophilus influenzae]|uniref:restriction endonuclease subunit S n=1 Tax=Haemophilus influenzae TaxID=727 RepID=UPI000F6E6A77|nr:restriction endonuclease subunit S [Haemophilus influenzae]VEI55128.1 type I site-specific restriction-modification system, S subunit [Haemophilus influenzae]
MRRYERYKDSGVDWLGEVPSHWELKRLKQLFVEKKHKQSLSLNCGAISFGKVIEKSDDKVTEATKRSYQEVLKGEFLINPLNLNYDLISLRIALSEIDVVVSAGYIVLKEKQIINKKYFSYLLHRYDVAYMKLLGSGVRQTINYGHISDSILVIPPLSEQQKIAQFLDDKTAKIDQAVELAEKQIALLKEHKQILIQNAVTRGLNPDVPLKDSGVEWIGQVPEHWEVKKLKFVLTLSNKKEESKNSNKRYIGMENIESFTGKINDISLIAEGIANSFYKDEILFGKLRPYLAKSYLADFDGICSTEFLVYRSTKVLNNRFALNIFLSYGFIDAVNASTYGSKMPRANAEFISNMFLAIPPLSEQKQIIDYLDTQTSKIDQAIALKTAHIEKLKEYKSVLINDVVTGKVRVSV